LGNPDFWRFAYYYIDAVSVIPDSIYLGVEDEQDETRNLKLYPNPNSGEFSIWLSLLEDESATIRVWSISSQEVYNGSLFNGTNQLELSVAAGLYLYKVDVNGKPAWTGKVSIRGD
jgi:hypothetical protein